MTIPESLRPFLKTPHFEDEREQVRAHLLNVVTLAAFVLFLVLPLFLYLTGNIAGEATPQIAAIWTLVLLVIVRILLYRRQLVTASYVLLIGGFLLLAFQSMNGQGLYSPRYLATFLLVLVTTIILGIRPALAMVAASFILGGYLTLFGNNVPLEPFTLLVLLTFYALLTIVIISGILATLYRVLEETKLANAELQQTQEAFAQRIAERTRTLETILSLSRELSLILDQDVLLREMVERVRSVFDFYYTQIYLLDPAGSTLSLVAGTGPAGQTLLAAGHKLSIGEGLVGQAAQENRPVLVADVKSSRQWLPNPHLPATQAEAVIPISVGDRVLGVLDVQHDRSEGLTDENVSVLQAMANQAAIALQNAGLYTAADQRARREAQINALSEQIQQANSIESVLQIAAAGVGKALSSKRTTVYLQPARNQDHQRPLSNGERM